jgi:phosphosulfolactate synthase (CoM biosynthesis protein A)
MDNMGIGCLVAHGRANYIKTHVSNANLGNIHPSEVIALETMPQETGE